MHEDVPDILMAEDSADDAELTLGALAEYHLAERVILVTDGAEALDYLHRRGRFDGRPGSNPVLLLLDLKMPKVNGLEVLEDMKKNANLSDIPVVMLSSSCEESNLRQARELGATAYVVKPVRFADFVDAVKTIGKFWGILNVLRTERVDSASRAAKMG